MHDRNPNEKSNWNERARDSEVKQLFLNSKSLKALKDHFLFIKFILFIAPPFCNLSFYYKLDEVLKLKQKNYNFFSFCHPQGDPY